MNLDKLNIDEIRTVLEEETAAHLPEGKAVFERAWARCAVELKGLRPRSPGTHQQAECGATEYDTVCVIMTMFAVLKELPEPAELIGKPALEEMAIAAARTRGVVGGKLQLIAEASSSSVYRVLSKLESQSGFGILGQAAEDAIWVESWQSSKHEGVRCVDAIEPLRSESAQAFDLLVDEPARCLRTRDGRTMRFDEIDGKTLIGVWLSLSYTEVGFGHDEIGAVLSTRANDEASRRKYPSSARKLFYELLGRDIVGYSRRGRYPVPADAWSWRWIRSSRVRESSRLLT